MKDDQVGVSQQIGTAVERAFAKIEVLFARVMDGELTPVMDPVVEPVLHRRSDSAPGPAPAARARARAPEVDVAPPPPTTRVRAVGPSADWWPQHVRLQPGEALVIVSLALTGLAVGVPGVPIGFRVLATFWFLLACPGFAALRLLQFRNPAILATLSLAASIGIDTVLSEIMLYTHTWSPAAAVAWLAVFSLAALAAGRRYQGRFGHALS